MVFGALLIAGRARQVGLKTAVDGKPNSVEAAVTNLISAAQSGNEAAYRACLVDDVAGVELASSSQSGPAIFASDLRVHRSDLTGHVISDVNQTENSSASLVLELVFRRENVRYQLQMRKVGDRWKVANLAPLNRFQPEIPYGTPVE